MKVSKVEMGNPDTSNIKKTVKTVSNGDRKHMEFQGIRDGITTTLDDWDASQDIVQMDMGLNVTSNNSKKK